MSKTVWLINQYASTPEYGYAGRHYYLGKELVKKGYTVYLIVSAAHHLLRNKPQVDSSFLIEKDDGLNIVWVKMPSYTEAHSKIRALSWFLFPLKIQRLASILSEKPDVVLCSSPSLISFLGAKRLAKKFQTRLIFEVRDIWPMTLIEVGGFSKKHPFIRFMQWVEDKAYLESDAVVSNLKNAVEHMVSRGMDRSKFNWIPNGFSLEEVELKSPLNNNSAAKLPANKFLIGYTGTMGAANALDTLIDSAEQLKYDLDVAFVLVGEGKEKVVLQQRVNEMGLNNVIFIDSIPKIQIQSMLSQFDACYIGLTKDPLFRFGVSPNKLFDYLYSGKPIIYGIDSGEYQPVGEVGAGIQIPAENSECLTKAVLDLKSMSPEERLQLGINGREAALEQYEYKKLSDSFASVLFD